MRDFTVAGSQVIPIKTYFYCFTRA